MKIGSAVYDLSGADTFTTGNATNRITVLAEGEISIILNGAGFENGTTATWREGENTLTVTVDGETYSVTVVKE